MRCQPLRRALYFLESMREHMKCALIYDFDGTLAEGDCAQHGLMTSLGINDVAAFWKEVKSRAQNDDGDEILAYLGLLAEKANQLASDELSNDNLIKHGKCIPLFPGVDTWFDRINEYGKLHGLDIEHYIISSGLDAMIQGTVIGSKFRKIYACKYHYSIDGKKAIWPAQAINYTTKTQFLFRINKGIDNSWDNAAVNKFVEPNERTIPFQKMIYFGDGDTDIPSMKMVRYQGGFSLAVFDQKKWSDSSTQIKVEKLIAEERANYVVPAVYEEGSQLDVTVKGLLQLFKRKKI
ncbi:TPA: haloacid dehalogenase-like hydrolase, partial [Vibrio cholerae]|nr:haloacid dehalogenase-like hydrolase family protein [Vibrio cholerae O1 str. EM-1676A]MCD1196814.1 phosphoserine phosphatase [Vibrio cholerae]MCD1200436.1 phosphoserine phosphatase [Vibrio cholerae]MCD1209540.1 phosphoserine phosphatase [Vibrio cholerae]MCD1216938.1 phosphoserine phosphatase [Vibrio cholerae]